MKTVVSVSGGKDSTALLALAVVQEVPGLLAVFADTGHEHPLTIDYVAYLSDWLERQGHVGQASKRGAATMFPTADGRGIGVRAVVEWSKTSRGGGQYDLLRAVEAPAGCSSVYGLCE